MAKKKETKEEVKTEKQETPAGVNPNIPPIIINSQYMKDLSFEAPNTPMIFQELKAAPDVEISVDVQANKLQEKTFSVDLKFNVKGKSGNNTAFLTELVYGSIVTLNVPDEHLEPVLLIEVPRHLFPFARNIIADTCREGGFPPLMINPIDFVALYNQNKANQQAANSK